GAAGRAGAAALQSGLGPGFYGMCGATRCLSIGADWRLRSGRSTSETSEADPNRTDSMCVVLRFPAQEGANGQTLRDNWDTLGPSRWRAISRCSPAYLNGRVSASRSRGSLKGEARAAPITNPK